MLPVRIFFILILCFGVDFAFGQDNSLHPTHITILDASKGAKCLKQCSRATPENVTRFFRVNKSDSLLLIKNLKKILFERSVICCSIGFSIQQLDKYALQLEGLVIGGKKFVYINAFRWGDDDVEDESSAFEQQKWRLNPIIICDGRN